MTAIALARTQDGRHVVMAGDRKLTAGDQVFVSDTSKVWRPHPQVLIGYAGVSSAAQVLAKIRISRLPKGLASRDFVRDYLAQGFRDAMKEDERLYRGGTGVSCLVVCRGEPFYLDHDGFTLAISGQYAAIGSGSAHVEGAMFAQAKRLRAAQTPHDLVACTSVAIQAAAKHLASVGEPKDFLTWSKEDAKT